MTIDRLNQSEVEDVRRAFLECCGSRAWADAMTTRRPYRTLSVLQETAQEVWRALEERDWLEAFAAHPQIGAMKPAAKWSADEQSGMAAAAEETAAAISRLNEEYKRKFGWIFIVCASGKSAEEMLQMLRKRIENDPDTELPIAVSEQLEIMRLRLEKLVSE